MLEPLDRKLNIAILGTICTIAFIVVVSASLTQAMAQMNHIQNNNATANKRTMVFEPYENPSLGIKLQHPKDWPVSTQKLGQTTVIRLNSTRQSDMETIPPVILVSIEALPQSSKTLDDLTRSNMADAAKLNNFHLIESNTTQLGDHVAKKILYSYSSDDPSLTFPLKSMDIWTVSNGKKYIFSYIDAQHEFVKQLPIVNKILGSIKIY